MEAVSNSSDETAVDIERDASPVIIEQGSQDWLLAQMISVLNRSGGSASLPITLLVSGSMISGQLIGGQEFFDLYGDTVGKVLGDDTGGITASFSAYKKLYEFADSDEALACFVHLRDAKVFSGAGNPIPNSGGMLWRGQLSSVDGFSIGKLTVDENNG